MKPMNLMPYNPIAIVGNSSQGDDAYEDCSLCFKISILHNKLSQRVPLFAFLILVICFYGSEGTRKTDCSLPSEWTDPRLG